MASKHRPFYTPDYVGIRREIPLPDELVKKKPYDKPYRKPNYNYWVGREEEIIEFCKTPKSNTELKEFFKPLTFYRIKCNYLLPLVRAGKLM